MAISHSQITAMETELLGLLDVTRRASRAAAAVKSVSPCGPEVFRCLDFLKRFQDFPMTPSVIKSTHLLEKLLPLTRHPIIKIRTAADSLIQKFNNILSDAKQSKKITRGSLVIRLKLPQKPTVPKCDGAKMSPIHKKVSLTNPCNIDISRDKVRELVLDSLSKAVAENGGVTDIDPSVLATKIESVMFKVMGSFNGPNKLKYRSILFNLKDPNNPDLRRKVLRGKVTPEVLVSMKAEEMASHRRRRENRQIRKKLAVSKKHIEAKIPEKQETEL